MVTIIDVTNNKKLFKKFVDFPNELYKGSPYYVPFIYPDEINMLNPKKNPALAECKVKCFIAMRGKKVVGRVAGILQQAHNNKTGENRMRFSRLDFIDDEIVVKALLNAVEEHARQEGMNIVHGPFGFNDTDREGYLTEGFDEIATLTTNYNFDYYDKRIKEQGYQKECGWLESDITVPLADDPRVQKFFRLADMIQRRYSLKVLKYKKIKQLIKERVDGFFDIYFEAYRDLPGFIDFSDEQKKLVAKTFGDMLRPDFVPLVADKDDKLIAFGVILPDLTRHLQKSRGRLNLITLLKILRERSRPKKKMECMLIGVSKEWRNKGVNALLMTEVFKELQRLGITNLETNLNAEDNHEIQAFWDTFDRRVHKRRICVYKNLD